MKARHTAQRVALNLLSTLVMIRLGRVAKLVGRRENILRRLSGRSEEELRDALQRAGGNLKKAMLFWNRPAGVCKPRCGLQEDASEIASEMPTVDADIGSAMWQGN
jgi:N-acetylmuramic acid 6-phosphate etherase